MANNRYGRDDDRRGMHGRDQDRGREAQRRDDRRADQSSAFNQGFGAGHGGRDGEGGYGARSPERGGYGDSDRAQRFEGRWPIDDRFEEVPRTRQEALDDKRHTEDRMDQGGDREREARGSRDDRLHDRRGHHSASGLEVFDRSLQSTHIWLNEIIDEIGPDKQVAWHVLTAVLRTIRDRVRPELAVHLGAQLPLLIRGAYYDQFRLSPEPDRSRNMDDFLHSVADHMRGIGRPVNPRAALHAVARTLNRHISGGQVRKIVDSLPRQVQWSWEDACRNVEIAR